MGLKLEAHVLLKGERDYRRLQKGVEWDRLEIQHRVGAMKWARECETLGCIPSGPSTLFTSYFEASFEGSSVGGVS